MDGTFQTTADLYQRGPYRPFLEEARTIGAAPLPMVVMTQGAGAHPEPALPQYGLNLVLAGACGGRFDFGAGAFAMPHRPGEIALAPPSVACDYRAEGPHRVLCLCLPAGRVELLLDEAGGRPSDLDGLHRRAFQDPLVAQIASRSWDEAIHGGLRGALYAEGAVLAIAASLLRLGAPPRRAVAARARATRLPPWRLRRALDLMLADLAAPLSLADLAAAAGLSPHHFAQAFKETTGLPPHAWLTARRVERAQAILLDGRRPLADVAAACGFAFQQHFTTVFKKATGAAPAAWRRERAG